MKTARQADSVTWWSMGRAMAQRHGMDKAAALADQIRHDGPRTLFLSGARGEPKPRVRKISKPKTLL